MRRALAPELALDPLSHVQTSTLPELLDHFGVSVLVTTYQAGRLVLVSPIS